MRFEYGCTRFVILTDRYAFKIARVQPLRPFVRIAQHLFGKKISPELLTYNKAMARGCVRFLIPGIIANREECRNYKKCGKNDILVPTIFSFFWLVNIQLAGKPATQEEVNKNPLYRGQGSDPAFDIDSVYQYCVIEGKTLLADYGQEGLLPVLMQYAR